MKLRPLILLAVLLIAPAAFGQRNPKHCDQPEPLLDAGCFDAPKLTRQCMEAKYRKLNCDIARILAQPVHHVTAQEWHDVYEALGPDWELYDAIETLNLSGRYYPYYPSYPPTYYPPMYPGGIYRPVYVPTRRRLR